MKTRIVSTNMATVMVTVLVLLISFQNCQKPPHPDEISGRFLSQSLDPIPGGALGKIDLNLEVIEGISFIVPDTKLVNRAGHTYQVSFNKTLQVDLRTGSLLESSDLDSTTKNYCLTESLKNELIAILKSSQVCKKQSLPEGTVCAQVMKLPYAQVSTNKEQIDLGGGTDSCGSNSMDLCEAQASLLKGYIEMIKKQYTQLVCSN